MRALICSLVLMMGCASAEPTDMEQNDNPHYIPATKSVKFKFHDSFINYTNDFNYPLIFIDAADAWRETFGATIIYDDTAKYQIQCATWDMGSAAATANGGGIAVNCLYFYGMSSNGKRHLVIHEVGHMLGLLHVDDSAAMMYPTVSDYTAFTIADLLEYVRVNGWTDAAKE